MNPRAAVQAFYDQHPYPPPVENLDDYRRRWQDITRRRADFHLHWPGQAYRTGLSVLVAGCGTAQAARHALRQPDAQVTGIDLSETSVAHTRALKQKYGLKNLEVYQLPIERVGELNRRFDKIVCTGVLHHLPDPGEGLAALGEVLAEGGVMNLMVYAAYGRAGVYMLQEYCRRLGIGHSDQEIRDLANTLTALPHSHPLAHLLAASPDFQRKDALADALLNPQDRAYTVAQLFELLAKKRLKFIRWVRQAPYLPQCGSLAATPHAARLGELPQKEQFAAVELFRGNMLRHNFIAGGENHPGDHISACFKNHDWPELVPMRLPDTVTVRDRVPPGATAVLINQAHHDADLFLPLDADEARLFEAIDGKSTIGAIMRRAGRPGERGDEKARGAGQSGERGADKARAFFERLYSYDQIVFHALT